MSFGISFNPQVTQGTLNRTATHIVVSSFQALNVSAGYMTKSLAKVTLEGPAVDQIDTATGVINSPKVFVMGQVVINLLRSQSLANLWLAQYQLQCVVGSVIAYSDSNTFSPITLSNMSIIDFDPGAFDGADPTTAVTLKGQFYVNSSLWSGTTASLTVGL